VSFLAPLWLALAGAALVPLLLHLLRRRIGTRVEFPAARYLARAEREHSRSLRLRNLLLMLLRVLAVLLVALAAAGPVARWASGAGHAPAAVAIMLDNSLSSTAVTDGRPLLDQFRDAAKAVVGQAQPGDRLWLVTADGRVRGGSPAAIREAIDRLEPLAGAGDPRLAAARAAAAVRASGYDARQVAVLTDAQRSAWREPVDLGDVHTLVWAPRHQPPPNRAVLAAEARPVRWTPRGTLAGRVATTDSASYRVTIAGRVLLRGTAASGEEIAVTAAPPERGWLGGTLELEPDELPADNVRHYAVWVGAAPGVTASPAAGPFVRSAIDVLKQSRRIVDGRDVAIVPADELTTLPALVVAPASPVRLGAANRALERAGVPWRFGQARRDDSVVRGARIDGATTTLRYSLVPQAGAVAETLATAGRDPWIVAGPRFVLVGSPLTPDATTLPIRASFVPWLAETVSERLAGEPGHVLGAVPGAALARPQWADALETPSGAREGLTGETMRAPDRAGTYFLSLGARRVGAIAVNPEPEESALERLSVDELRARLRARRTVVAATPATWASDAFRSAARRPLVTPLLMLALLALAAEGLAAGAGGTRKVA
jgi:aerotolerance regulator-like protein/VWA domain-containing protein